MSCLWLVLAVEQPLHGPAVQLEQSVNQTLPTYLSFDIAQSSTLNSTTFKHRPYLGLVLTPH